MLKPAICYKDAVEQAMAEYFYSDDMMYFKGCLDNNLLEIADNNNDGQHQYAVLDSREQLIGFIEFWVDYYSSCAYGICAFSFERGNPVMGKELFSLLENLVKTMHRVEFKAVSGNPAISGYDKFLTRHRDIGAKHVLRDVIKDRQGNYRDLYIYEFVN